MSATNRLDRHEEYDEGKKRTASVTLRLSTRSLSRLRHLSKDRHMSLNALCESSLEKYLTWYQFQETLGYIPISQNGLRQLFGNISPEDAGNLGKQVTEKYIRATITYIFGNVTKQSTLDYLFLFTVRFRESRHLQRNGMHTLILKHDINKSFSIYLASGLLSLIKLIDAKAVSEITDDTVSLSFSFP
ncbi:MAG: hypothetical protein HYU39_08690 [Thaumarchaeota archaeon]|nr:hypothetical protein [Nitrososphaerota archaeon]